MDTEYFDVVNYRDDVVGRESRSKVHQGRLLHRAVHVFVRSEKQDWVLQQRSAFKDLDPLLWTSSCSGHLDAGEDYISAAIREAQEELGVEVMKEKLDELLRVSPCQETGIEFVRVYAAKGIYTPSCPTGEVASFASYSLDEIVLKIQEETDQFSGSFLHIFNLIKCKLYKFT